MSAIAVEDWSESPAMSLGQWDQLLDDLEADPAGWGAPSREVAQESLLLDGRFGKTVADLATPEERREAARTYFRDAARRYDSRTTFNPATGDVGIYKGEPIAFAEGAWAAYSRAWVESLARSQDQPRHLRLLFAAMARVQPRSGVAYFAEGELRDVLGELGKSCSKRRVTEALARAKELALILPESDAHRVWLDRQHVQRGR